MDNYLEGLICVAQDNEWSVDVEDKTDDYIIYRFGKYSPSGQDFSFSAEAEGYSADSLLENIYEIYQNYDPSSEAYIWLDSEGHGINGAPYDMKDVYEDMEACQEMIGKLHNLLTSEYEVMQ